MNRQKQIEEKGFIISVANDFQFIPNSSKWSKKYALNVKIVWNTKTLYEHKFQEIKEEYIMIVLWYTKSPMNEEVHGRGSIWQMKLIKVRMQNRSQCTYLSKLDHKSYKSRNIN